MDFKWRGLRDFPGSSGLTVTVRYRTVREVGRNIGSYGAYSIGTVVGTVEYIFPNILLFNMDSEERKLYPMTPDLAIFRCRTKIEGLVFLATI